jgi:hypothetical protein
MKNSGDAAIAIALYISTNEVAMDLATLVGKTLLSDNSSIPPLSKFQ